HSEISSIFDWNRSSNNHDNQEKQGQGVVSTYKQPSFKEESLEISAANILDNIRTTPLSQLSPCVPDDTYITEVKHSESGLPQTPSGGKTIYIQGSQAGTRTYYQNKGNPWQADKQTSCLQTRPPPPPYPECQSEVKQHPIRPNSLPLGETNSKKTHDSPSIGNTPTVDSGQLTPIQGTGFYSSQRGVRYVKHGNQLTPTALSSPHHIRRTGSGKNGRGIVQSPCCTETNYVNGEFIPVASTPTIHNDIQQTNLTHRLESEFGKQPEQEYWSANRSKQFSG
uniref:Uncharacterized protein n=1 Tax=Ciona savignyi TaxID=51511 RepID=H2ZQZ1_CIOSA